MTFTSKIHTLVYMHGLQKNRFIYTYRSATVFYKKMTVTLPAIGQRSDTTMDDDSYNDISDDDDEYDPEDVSRWCSWLLHSILVTLSTC